MLRDPTHLFRRMWAAEAWAQQQPNAPKCWERKRDNYGRDNQTSETFFKGVFAGSMCSTNWYEGNPGELGHARKIPEFSKDAVPLLGFDESIDWYCRSKAPPGKKNLLHAERCVAASLNILSIFGERVPYNLCRNFEWQSCAVRGLLPGQRSNIIRFATPPIDLDPTGLESGKPLGQCRGWLPPVRPRGWNFGYATDDVFFLEVCLFNQLCRNGDELFSLGVGEGFQCDYDPYSATELQKLLLEGHESPDNARSC